MYVNKSVMKDFLSVHFLFIAKATKYNLSKEKL